MKNGWHTIQGREVYVEDNYIVRGMTTDTNGSKVPAKPFRLTKDGWSSTGRITPAAFRAGVSRGTIDLF